MGTDRMKTESVYDFNPATPFLEHDIKFDTINFSSFPKLEKKYKIPLPYMMSKSFHRIIILCSCDHLASNLKLLTTLQPTSSIYCQG